MIATLTFLEYARMIPLLVILLVAAYQDVKNTVKVQLGKETFTCGVISNKLWLFAPVGATLLLAELYLIPSLLWLTVGSIAFSVMVAFVLYSLKGWGGADFKAFLTIAVSAPLFPLGSFLFPLSLPFAVLLVACLSAVVYALLRKSDVPFGKRKVRFLPFIFLGYVVSLLV